MWHIIIVGSITVIWKLTFEFLRGQNCGRDVFGIQPTDTSLKKSYSSSSLGKDISTMIMDMAEFQRQHGAESLRKLVVKIGSTHRIKTRIETLCNDLTRVSHQINVWLCLIRILGNLKFNQSSDCKRWNRSQSKLASKYIR